MGALGFEYASDKVMLNMCCWIGKV